MTVESSLCGSSEKSSAHILAFSGLAYAVPIMQNKIFPLIGIPSDN